MYIDQLDITVIHYLSQITNMDFVIGVWTGGRDSQKPSQFSWDTNGEILDSTLHRRMVFDNIQTCLYYHPSPQQHFLHAATCTTKRAVLCQITHGILVA